MLIGKKNFVFAENLKGQAECLICGREVVTKKYNIERYYRSCHRDFEEIKDDKRAETLLLLKKTFLESMVTEYEEENSTSNAASCSSGRDFKEKPTFIVALALAKQCRPFTDADFFKELSSSVLGFFFWK